MIIKATTQNDELNIKIEGFFDCTEIIEYDKFVEEELPKHQFTKVNVDLGDLEFIDSMGMGRLIILKKKITKDNKKMIIVNVPEDIKNIFKIAELSQYLLEE